MIEHCGVDAVILNGGKARRMNSLDKSQLVVEGQTILERQLQLLHGRVSQIAMVGGSRQHQGVHALGDRVGGLGPIDGIAAALAWSAEPWILVLACDMPRVVPQLVDLLLSERGPRYQIVGTSIEGRAQPLLALYHRSLLPVLDACLARSELRASRLLSHPPEGVLVHLLDEAAIRRVDPNCQSFQNFNTPDDLFPTERPIE